MLEPGLDRHEWESEWASLEEELEDSPADVLPQLDELLERMLNERGYAVEDPVVRAGDDRDVIADFLAAREITRLRADDPDAVSPGDVAATGPSSSSCSRSAEPRNARAVGAQIGTDSTQTRRQLSVIVDRRGRRVS